MAIGSRPAKAVGGDNEKRGLSTRAFQRSAVHAPPKKRARPALALLLANELVDEIGP